MDIVLASKSPRRTQLLKLITEKFTVVPSTKQENLEQGLSAEKLALALAVEKCEDITQNNPNSCVIGCDTVVEVDGKILGKPKDKANAKEMLLMLSHNKHSVYTGVCIYTPNETKSFVSKTDVFFVKLSQYEIENYIDSGEPFDKAGGYGIQGLAAKFISRIEGDYYNIMGFPVCEVYDTLKQLCVIV